MNKVSIRKILILAAILAMPGFLYYLLQEKGKNRYKNLSYFGPKEVAGTFHTVRGKKIPDTIYHVVKASGLIDQDNDTTAFATSNSQALIVSLFYSRGGYSVQAANAAIAGLYKGYKKNKVIRFVSISIDPEFDTPEVLKQYAAGLGAEKGKWDFLTGNPAQIRTIVKEGLLLDVIHADGKISYNNMLVLLDQKNRIRGYYDAVNKESVAKLDDEIKVLIAEELRGIKDGR